MLPLAALLAAVVSRHAPSHRPLSAALLLCSALDQFGPMLPPRADLAVWVLACLAQAWGARRALREPGLGAAFLALGAASSAWCLLAPPGRWWSALPVLVLVLASASDLTALAARRAGRAPATAGSRAGAVLAGSDVAALVVAVVLGVEALGPPGTVGAAGVAAVEALFLAGVYGRRDEAHVSRARSPSAEDL